MPEALTGSTTTTPTPGFNSVTGASGTAATSTKPGGDLDKDAFLKLLVAQLKYQNPMSPADPNEFLGQTAQFTMVEKLEEISKAQSDLTVWQKVTAGQSLVGRQVTGKSDLGTDVTSVVTGLTLGTDGPQLMLADGSKMSVTAVTAVTAPGAKLPTTTLPTTSSSSGTTAGAGSTTSSVPTGTATSTTPTTGTDASPEATGSTTSGTTTGSTAGTVSSTGGSADDSEPTSAVTTTAASTGV